MRKQSNLQLILVITAFDIIFGSLICLLWGGLIFGVVTDPSPIGYKLIALAGTVLATYLGYRYLSVRREILGPALPQPEQKIEHTESNKPPADAEQN